MDQNTHGYKVVTHIGHAGHVQYIRLIMATGGDGWDCHADKSCTRD